MDLKGRDFLKLLDFTPEEIEYLLDLAADLKDKKKKGIPVDTLRGKNVALIFEKTSTRTRCAFEVAAHDLGMGTTYLDPGIAIGILPILDMPVPPNLLTYNSYIFRLYQTNANTSPPT